VSESSRTAIDADDEPVVIHLRDDSRVRLTETLGTDAANVIGAADIRMVTGWQMLAAVFERHLAAEVETIEKLSEEEITELGARAAAQVVASARWSQVIGDRLDTSQVSQLLDVSRQALAKRQRTGSILGLRGDGTTWYPTWQFDMESGSIRPTVRDLIGAFRDRLGQGCDPLLIASWAQTPQHEDLAGETPARWIQARSDPDQLRRSAERAAARLAQ